MRKYTALAVAAIAAFGLVSCTSGAVPTTENTAEVKPAEVKPADRVPKSVDWETSTEFEGTNIVRYTLETSDGRLVDCFRYDWGYEGGLSCLPLEPEPETEPATE